MATTALRDHTLASLKQHTHENGAPPPPPDVIADAIEWCARATERLVEVARAVSLRAATAEKKAASASKSKERKVEEARRWRALSLSAWGEVASFASPLVGFLASSFRRSSSSNDTDGDGGDVSVGTFRRIVEVSAAAVLTSAWMVEPFRPTLAAAAASSLSLVLLHLPLAEAHVLLEQCRSERSDKNLAATETARSEVRASGASTAVRSKRELSS